MPRAIEMCLSSDLELLDEYWQSLVYIITVSIDPALPEGLFYVRYRDIARCMFENVSTSYQIGICFP